MTDRRFQSRKFILASGAFVGGVVFFALGMLTADQWMSHTAWAVGIYAAANIGDSAVTRTGG